MSFKLVPTWITRDKREIPIHQMETEHLHSTINMLRRKHFVTEDERGPLPIAPCGITGEYAEMFAEQEFDREMEAWMRVRVHPALKHLEAEAKRRAKESP